MVTMIEGSWKMITMRALSAPMASPAPSPTAMATGIGSPMSCAKANRQAESAMLDAGDRSISPEMITMVSTSATIASSAESVKLLRI